MPIMRLHYKGFDVTIKSPLLKIEGKYTVQIGNLVTAYPIVKKIKGSKFRIFWGRKYGRFDRLLRGALKQYFMEESVG